MRTILVDAAKDLAPHLHRCRTHPHREPLRSIASAPRRGPCVPRRSGAEAGRYPGRLCPVGSADGRLRCEVERSRHGQGRRDPYRSTPNSNPFKPCWPASAKGCQGKREEPHNPWVVPRRPHRPGDLFLVFHQREKHLSDLHDPGARPRKQAEVPSSHHHATLDSDRRPLEVPAWP